MNFTTLLPKHDPLATYLVATGTTDQPKTVCYRMHAVVLSGDYSRSHSVSDVKKIKEREKNDPKLRV